MKQIYLLNALRWFIVYAAVAGVLFASLLL